jgi:hypothetical protein
VRLESEMPALLSQMRADLKDCPLRREFVLLQQTWRYLAVGNEFVYYYDDHSELDGQIRILQNHGLVRDITRTRVKRYALEEALVDYLKNPPTGLTTTIEVSIETPTAPSPPSNRGAGTSRHVASSEDHRDDATAPESREPTEKQVAAADALITQKPDVDTQTAAWFLRCTTQHVLRLVRKRELVATRTKPKRITSDSLRAYKWGKDPNDRPATQ